jgi:predicted SnoaL-like aldol condensation-catalyzing enzyme
MPDRFHPAAFAGARVTAVAAAVAVASGPARAQVAPTPHPHPEALLASRDPALARNKRLVYDFWREVLEARRVERADRYVTAHYVQHNPTVPTGRRGLVAFVAGLGPPAPVAPRMQAPLVAVVAERDLVVLSFTCEFPEPGDPTKRYTTTCYDTFRVAGGRIAEHWDSSLK